MCSHFRVHFKDFKIVSPGFKRADFISISDKIFRQSYLICKLFLTDKNTIVYTRNKVVSLISVYLGRKTIIEVHDTPKNFLNKVVSYFLFRNLDNLIVIFISNSLSQKFRSIYNRKYSSYVFHDCVSEDFFSKIDPNLLNKIRKKKWGIKKPFICHFGSLYKIDLGFFKTLNKVKHQFIFIGAEKKELEKFNVFLKNENIRNVKIFSKVKRKFIPYLIYLSDILLYVNSPSSSIAQFTSPLKLFEYMLSDKPILFNDFGSISEIINSDLGWKYDYKDSNSIQNQIDDIINRNYQCKLKTSNIIITNYTWDKRVLEIKSIIKNKWL